MGLIVVVSGWLRIGLVPICGPDSSNKYNMEVAMKFVLEISVMDWTTKSTSISIFVSNNVPKVIVSEMVTGVDVVCSDRLRKLGEATEVEGGIFSTMCDAVWDRSSLSVRYAM